jgi:hypothetical protein
MKIEKAILTIIVILASSILYSQEIKSNTVRFRLNNIHTQGSIKDDKPPEIILIKPEIHIDSSFETDKKYLDLIGEVIDDSKIRFVSVNREVLIVNESGVYVTSLPLEVGLNEIRIRALDDYNNLQELILKVQFKPPIITLEDRIRSHATYYGLLIGINDYDDPTLSDLDNPIRDAENLYYTLTRSYVFSPGNVTILRNTTRAEIIRALDDLRNKVTVDDNVLIFYAGHGYYDEEAGIGYWLPSDAHQNNTANWFRNSTLVDYLKAIDSKHTLLISDACFAGSIFKSRSVTLSQEVVYDKIYELPSRKAMTSGTLTEVPDESPFIKFLIERLEQNEDLYLSSEDLFFRLRDAVIYNSNVLPRYGEIQNVGNEGGDFIFLKQR